MPGSSGSRATGGVPISGARAALKARGKAGKFRLGWQCRSFAADPVLVPPQRRARVHPVELERHPVRADIAFLKHEGAYGPKLGDAMRLNVIRSTVAEQQ